MWIRSRLDIGWCDLARGLVYCGCPGSIERAEAELRDLLPAEHHCLTTLSVRSGFDLLLRAMQLPRGSEVVFSALTIPDMLRIVEHHGLVPVPVDMDASGQVDPESLEQSISSRTRLAVFAHLFGLRGDLKAVVQRCSQGGIFVVEDCAQCFEGFGSSQLQGDIAMYSFGPIKTATALGGGVLQIASLGLAEKMRALRESDQRQSNWRLARRVLRFSLLKLLTLRPLSKTLFVALGGMGVDPDRIINQLGRGFPPGRIVEQIRCRPSVASLRLLRHRLATYDLRRIATRSQIGICLDKAGGIHRAPGHTYWAYALESSDRERLIQQLRQNGFDATSVTRMCLVESAVGNDPETARATWDRTLFVPCYPELPKNEIHRLASLLVTEEN